MKRRALALCDEAQAFHMSGDLERAIELYSRSIEIYPTAEAFTFRGWAYGMMGRTDDAIEECKKAIATDPSFGNPYNDIGAYLLGRGQLDEAVPWLERAKTAERYEPKHFPYMNLGRVYAAKGLVLRAIREYEAALQIHPGDAVCQLALQELRGRLN